MPSKPNQVRLTLIAVSFATAAAFGRVPQKSLIVPGQSVGELKLGQSKEQFRNVLNWKPNVDEDYSYPGSSGCLAREELHWLDAGNPPFSAGTTVHAGVFAYLRNGRIFQIAVATPLFQTADGITENSSPEKVKRSYPHLEAYWRVNQRDLATGDRDFIYWVDENKGVAFEFFYARNVRKRLVYRIYVFEQGANFVPEGCIQSPQSWRKLQPYSLEPPVEKPR